MFTGVGFFKKITSIGEYRFVTRTLFNGMFFWKHVHFTYFLKFHYKLPLILYFGVSLRNISSKIFSVIREI
jgi:hypothetical protein